ncbi:MAG: flagellar hook-associated protein FlgL [Planctomycetes bacterium]|nr:flagellar hook-associated protein FlgL [Planctomycetota bacterium]
MSFRVTPQVILNSALANSSLEMSRLADLQLQASTGKRINAPSDAPLDLSSLLASKAQDLRLDTYLSNINSAKSVLDTSVSSLQDASNILTKAKSLAIEASNSSNTAEAQNSIAQEVDELLARLLDLANTQSNGRYLYGGVAVDTKPFVETTDSLGRIQSVTYQGVDQRGAMLISPQHTVDTYYSGAQVFQTRNRQTTVYTGNTGAAAGTGTDTALGQGTLQVRHTSTTFAPGSGVQAGASSAAGDTILGASGTHKLTIVDTSGTGAAGTVSLDGGPAIAFTNADTDLAVTNGSGDIVYVNTTAIAAGFNGTVDITANGTLSVDGGASTVPINFSANQAIVDSQTGAITNVASSGIARTGDAHLEYSGTSDVFQVLMALRDDLRNTRGLSATEQTAVLSSRIGEIDRVHADVLRTVGEQSASLQNMESLSSHLQDVQVTAKKLISELEDADVGQLVLKLQAQQNLLQATFTATSHVLNLSLLQ